MALPKKGTRTIIIDEVSYRYIGDATRMEGDDFGVVIIEKAEGARQKIRAHFSFTKLSHEYRSIGHAICHVADTIPPFVVRQTVLYAKKNGWNPDKGGGLLDLGNLDEKLDFSLLRPESQDPGRSSQ